MTAHILEQCNLDDGVVTTDLWFAGAVGKARTVTANTIERDPSGDYSSFCYVAVNSGSVTATTMTLIGPTPELDFSDSFQINGGTATITGVASATGDGTVVDRAGGTLKFDRALTIDDGADFYAAKGGSTTIDNLFVGKTKDDLIEIKDPGPTVTVTGEFVLGEDGSATLTISDDAVLNIDRAFVIGKEEGSHATMTVDDAGVTVNLRDEWRIGVGGTVTVGLNGGITVNALDGIQLGLQAMGNGTLNRAGDTTLVNVTGDVTIGVAGTGALLVRAGATFDAAASDVTLADEATAMATLTVTGDGSLFQAGNLTVGGAGTATPTGAPPMFGDEVLSGGEIDVASDLTIGDEASGKGRLLIGDPGSDLEVGGDATLGKSGAGVMVISGGDATVDGDMTLGAEKNSTGRLTVNSGSLDVSGKHPIGEAGTGAALVQLGSSLDAGDIEIGRALDRQGSLKLDGAATSATTGELTIGAGGAYRIAVDYQWRYSDDERGGDDRIGRARRDRHGVPQYRRIMARFEFAHCRQQQRRKAFGGGSKREPQVDGVMTIGADAGGTVTLGAEDRGERRSPCSAHTH